MRTNERTYRQYMSFDDPDKRAPLHDIACEYLTQPEKLVKLANLVGIKPDAAHANLSWPIPRDAIGRSASPFIVGYADVMATFGHGAFALIEVKEGRVSIAQAIQQISTYRQFLRPLTDGSSTKGFYVLATLYQLSTQEKLVLNEHGIEHIYLSPAHVAAFAKNRVKVEDLPF